MSTMTASCALPAGDPGAGQRPGPPYRPAPGPTYLPAPAPPGPGRRAGPSGPRPRPRVRLTRRGRLVALGLLLTLGGLTAGFAAPAPQAADPSGATQTATVLPGDTLWSVAERHRPGRDPFGTIERIRRLNGLTDYTIFPGQRLTLPPPR